MSAIARGHMVVDACTALEKSPPMERLRRSWDLFKASWAMLREDRTLLKYPLIAGVAVLLLVAVIGLPLALTGALDTDEIGPVQVIALFVLYFVGYAVVFLCNTALVSVVMGRMSGQPVADPGFGFARRHLGTILGYAAIAATVGVALNLIASKFEGVGRVVAALGGAAWSIASFLVVPVLVVEEVGPIEALKRSSSLLTKTWGEQLIGNAGIGIVTGLITFLIVAAGALLVWMAAMTGGAVLIGIVVVLVAAAVGLTLVVTNALDTIYRSAVYRYATNQPIEHYAAVEELPLAFQAPDRIEFGDRRRRRDEGGFRSTLRIRPRRPE